MIRRVFRRWSVGVIVWLSLGILLLSRKPLVSGQDCADGFYGLNCTEKCGHCQNKSCDVSTGNCPGGKCNSGYRGDRCITRCANGWSGPECGHPCGRCANGDPCDVINGECHNGCEPGWRGRRCRIECNGTHFGQNCLQQCGKCAGNSSCDTRTGVCSNGCLQGWKGVYCNESTMPSEREPDVPQGQYLVHHIVIIVVVSAGVVLVLGGLIFLVHCLCQRGRRNTQELQEQDADFQYSDSATAVIMRHARQSTTMLQSVFSWGSDFEDQEDKTQSAVHYKNISEDGSLERSNHTVGLYATSTVAMGAVGIATTGQSNLYANSPAAKEDQKYINMDGSCEYINTDMVPK